MVVGIGGHPDAEAVGPVRHGEDRRFESLDAVEDEQVLAVLAAKLGGEGEAVVHPER